jgi:hypothetical protein
MRFNRHRGGKPAAAMRVEFTLDGRDLAHGVLLVAEDEGIATDEVTADEVIEALREHLYERGREAIDYDAEDNVEDGNDIGAAEARARELWPEAFMEPERRMGRLTGDLPVTGGKATVMRHEIEYALLAGADVQVVDVKDGLL